MLAKTTNARLIAPDKEFILAFVFVTLAISVAVAGSAPIVSANGHEDAATIVEVYPDTYQPENDGEYVAIEFEEGTDTSGWTIEDGSDEMEISRRVLGGKNYFTRVGETRQVPVPSGASQRPLDLRLAARGDEIILRDSAGRVVDEVRYGDEAEGGVNPSEGEILIRNGEGATDFETRPYGSTDLRPLRTEVSGGTAFAIPDSGEIVGDRFSSAEDRLIVSAYTFGSEYLGDILLERARNSVDVSLLAESTPPGGLERPTENVLNNISSTRVAATSKLNLYTPDGDARRYRFFHAKYAVVDDSLSIIASENFEDRNFAPDADGSRGWGVTLRDEETAEYLAGVFEEDIDWRAFSKWRNADIDSYEQDGSDRSVETDYEPKEFGQASAEVFVAPDSAVEPIVSLIEEADSKVRIQQAYIRAWDDNLDANPYVSALKEEADEGAEVRILLDGRWFSEEQNRDVAESLESSDENITARIAERPVHTKGVIVDNESVLVSSINWNKNSPVNNREAGVILHDEKASKYFAKVFEDDWDGRKETEEGTEYQVEERESQETGSDTGEAGNENEEEEQPNYVLFAAIVLASGATAWGVSRKV